jgi:hypothetical protein
MLYNVGMGKDRRHDNPGRPLLGDKKMCQHRAIRLSRELCEQIERHRGKLKFGTFMRRLVILGLEYWEDPESTSCNPRHLR